MPVRSENARSMDVSETSVSWLTSNPLIAYSPAGTHADGNAARTARDRIHAIGCLRTLLQASASSQARRSRKRRSDAATCRLSSIQLPFTRSPLFPVRRVVAHNRRATDATDWYSGV